MSKLLRRVIALLLTLCMLPGLAVLAEEPPAEDAATQEPQAQNISGRSLVTDSTGFTYIGTMFDGEDREGVDTQGGASLTLEHSEGIGSLYIVFGWEYGAYTVTDNTTGLSHTCGESMYIHEFIDLADIFGGAPTSVTLTFDNGSVRINELYAFTAGQVPDFVQRWNAPADGRTDIVLFSTHGDDEQIFFAGLLPYYAGELGYRVQVVYLTDHRNQTDIRIHEMLNGLWAVGVTAYPVFGEYNDFYVESMEQAYRSFGILGWPREQMLGWVVEQLRRFRPQVAVGHDFAGEYGHGQHMVYADLLAEAVTVSMDENSYPESAERYGVWDVPKTYFHLYGGNPIVLDLDQPLDRFDGKTAFEVTRDLGYACHKSQYWDFAKYIVVYRSAESVSQYSPREYGLYRTTVGQDVQKNDFFEHLIPYAEQERIAEEKRKQEEQMRLEEERRQEEARRQEEERQKAEQERLEAECLQKEEQARLEAESQALAKKLQEEQREREKRILISALCILVAAAASLTAVIIFYAYHKKPKKSKKKKAEKIQKN